MPEDKSRSVQALQASEHDDVRLEHLMSARRHLRATTRRAMSVTCGPRWLAHSVVAQLSQSATNLHPPASRTGAGERQRRRRP